MCVEFQYLRGSSVCPEDLELQDLWLQNLQSAPSDQTGKFWGPLTATLNIYEKFTNLERTNDVFCIAVIFLRTNASLVRRYTTVPRLTSRSSSNCKQSPYNRRISHSGAKACHLCDLTCRNYGVHELRETLSPAKYVCLLTRVVNSAVGGIWAWLQSAGGRVLRNEKCACNLYSKFKKVAFFWLLDCVPPTIAEMMSGARLKAR